MAASHNQVAFFTKLVKRAIWTCGHSITATLVLAANTLLGGSHKFQLRSLARAPLGT